MFVPKLNDWLLYCDKLNPNEEIKIKSRKYLLQLKVYLFCSAPNVCALIWVKCGGQNLSMGYHIWPSRKENNNNNNDNKL